MSKLSDQENWIYSFECHNSQGENNVQNLDQGLNPGPLANRTSALPVKIFSYQAHYFPYGD